MEDFLDLGMLLSENRIFKLLDNNIITEDLCIVCKLPTQEKEFEYLEKIKSKLSELNIKYHIENNDVLTDYYICKEAETLICSNSTLSWCAAFFSSNLKTCYFPDYQESVDQTFKNPIENTILY